MTKKKGYQPATKAIILARVSTEDQADNGRYSVPAQLRKQREYAQSGGRFQNTPLEIIAEYEIEESAYKGKRTKFKKALEVIKILDESVAIIFDVVDRFSRRFEELLEFDELRKDGKVELHFISQGWQGLVIHRNSTQDELSVWEDEVAFARKFSRRISGNVRRSIREKLAQGIYPGGDLTTGYLSVDGNKILDPERAPFRKKIYELYATGKYNLAQLTKIMRNAGFTTKTKRVRVNGKLVEREPKLVTISDIADMLRNSFPTGKFYYPDPDSGERRLYDNKGTYPTLISWSLFQRVQKVLDSNNSRASGYKKNNFKFRGLLYCGFCGCTMTPEEMSRSYKNKNSRQASEVYYHCTNGKATTDPNWYLEEYGTDHSGVYVAKKGKKKGQTVYACPQRWWRESEIEEEILFRFDNINYGEDVFEWFRSFLEDNYETDIAVARANIKAKRTQYTKNEDLIKAIIRSMATEEDSELKEDYRKEYEAIKSNQNELKKEITIIEESLETDTDVIVKRLTYCSNLREQYENFDIEGKQKLLKESFSDIMVMRGECRYDAKKHMLGKKGKLEKIDYIDLEFDDPFNTLEQINIDELLDHWHEENEGVYDLTKENEMEASPKP